MKKKLFTGLVTGLFLLATTGLTLAVDDATVEQIQNDTALAKTAADSAKNKAETNDGKITGLYDNIAHLQSQIDDNDANLQNQIDEIDNKTEIFYGGLISSTPYEGCLANNKGFECSEKVKHFISVPMGSLVDIDAIQTATIIKDGEPFPIVEILKMQLLNRHRADGLGTEIEITMTKGTDSVVFTLAIDAPFHEMDKGGDGWAFMAALVTESQVVISMSSDSVTAFSTESIGVINDATLDPYSQGDTDARVTVEVENWGDLKTDYSVTVNGFSNRTDQVPAQMLILDPRIPLGTYKTTLVFDLHSSDGFFAGDTFLVSLWSPTGRLYDSIEISF